MRAKRTSSQGRLLVKAGLVLLLVSTILGAARATQVGYGKAGATGPESDIPHVKSFEGRIVKINVDQGAVAVEDKNGKQMVFSVNKKTRFKADKKTELEGKKNLALADFKSGEIVHVSYPEDGTIAYEVRLRASS